MIYLQQFVFDLCVLFKHGIFFSGLTTWSCAPPRVVVACCIPFCFLPLVFYPILAKKNESKYDMVKYHPIYRTTTTENTKTSHKIIHEINVLYKAFPFVIYYFLSNFCLHLTMTSLLSTLTFPTSPFLPRDHYQYYRLISDCGMVLGSLGPVLLSCVKLKEKKQVKGVLYIVLMNVTLTLIFFFATWFRFLPNVYVLFVLVFLQGGLFGATRVQAMVGVSDLFNDAIDKTKAMSYIHVAVSIARLAAGLLGLYVEHWLTRHCISRLLLGKYCLARVPTSSGWKTNVHCTSKTL